MTIKGIFQGVETTILLDTGASVSIGKEGFLHILNHENRRIPCPSALKTASGDLIEAHSNVGLDVTVNKHPFPYECLVYPTTTWDVILGADVMLKHKVVIRGAEAVAQTGEVFIPTHHPKNVIKSVAHVGVSEVIRPKSYVEYELMNK